MDRHEQINLIAYRIWEAYGRPDGQDEDNWLEAEALWEEEQKRRKCWLAASIPVVFGLVLLYEYLTKSFQLSNGLLFAGTAFITILYIWFNPFKRVGNWLLDLIGLGGQISFMVYEIGFLGGFLLSLYLLLGGPQVIVPSILQFSIVPVTATLGGLVIAGANYSSIDPIRRVELLRVAQKMIIATISFIFFAVFAWLAQLGGQIDPNEFGLEVAKSFFFWFGAFLFVAGAVLFVIGIIELAVSLKNLKK